MIDEVKDFSENDGTLLGSYLVLIEDASLHTVQGYLLE